MADYTKLAADVRTKFGKGAARKLRAADKIPAVVYGHGTEPKHISLPGHETMLLVRTANAVVDLDIEGTAQLALVKDVQRDPVRQIIEHIDLVVLRRGEKVTVDVPVVVEGESFSGTIHVQDLNTVSLLVLATDIPEHVTVDVEGLEDGAQITAAQLELPEGAELETDGEALVVQIVTPRGTADDDAADEASAEAGAEAGAEGGSEPVSE
ncbi:MULTISPECIES: 50S ribosomal protein L25/general stress protein Ctc [unclassified Curtobacterium]|uniref:50S ribosomal protein L25/general stress protein Ctc n=1 Tax=unclassified Curtobacterium TaxID=257496 RepID=UPI0008DCC9E9|nr:MULTISPECIES: 50S ribosomal protein L25/general stress protein Ctc [unclassified Curtobacterium]OIH93974.1 50S ribosomal protein L25/general stress protein Ctc [Curtobacterium sp. MCBA15_003]OII15985.1 50S ribosomal protein L25/general stress protein Ctc [Curtobacterium sp. MCBA15_009]OII33412.1 50S ribosomal protein L25/general stress protein Ctc [Curtobacterium sp. MMLR14_006]WIE65722.1 50S ribosomal protein L25/general stress protein Ctc [Curtobacterium sp. MCLR17_036]